MPSEHKHYWLLVGEKGHRWYKDHALVRCARCPAWSVTSRAEGVGPCDHVVAREETMPVSPLALEITQCPSCGALREGMDECEWCGVRNG